MRSSSFDMVNTFFHVERYCCVRCQCLQGPLCMSCSISLSIIESKSDRFSEHQCFRICLPRPQALRPKPNLLILICRYILPLYRNIAMYVYRERGRVPSCFNPPSCCDPRHDLPRPPEGVVYTRATAAQSKCYNVDP